VAQSCPSIAIFSVALFFCVACVRSGQQASGDAGFDAGTTGQACDAVAGPPRDGGITWRAGAPASVVPAQSTGWSALSADPECLALAPAVVPPGLSWPDAQTMGQLVGCYPAIADGEGDVALLVISNVDAASQTFLPADGSEAAVLKYGTAEHQGPIAPRDSGFVVATLSTPWCYFARLVNADGTASEAVYIDAPDPAMLASIIPNPLGGYVEVRQSTDGPVNATNNLLQLRWVDNGLQPLGNWHTAVEWPRGKDVIYWRAVVDQKGKTLLLYFLHPPSFGPPSPPSTWTFGARWMGRDGPLTDLFVPAAPNFRPASPSSPVLFAGWGMILSLEGGGIALFQVQAPASAGGTISPAGWYASYGSGQTALAQPPAWLRSYDGSIQFVAQAKGYAAIERDSITCRRTVRLIAPSGRACFTLSLRSELCDAKESITADGTLLLQDSCELRWWPKLVRLAGGH